MSREPIGRYTESETSFLRNGRDKWHIYLFALSFVVALVGRITRTCTRIWKRTTGIAISKEPRAGAVYLTQCIMGVPKATFPQLPPPCDKASRRAFGLKRSFSLFPLRRGQWSPRNRFAGRSRPARTGSERHSGIDSAKSKPLNSVVDICGAFLLERR